MDKELRILILEDVPIDAELEKHELRNSGLIFTSKVIATKEAFLNALDEFMPDLILSDYKLLSFDGIEALTIAKEKCPDVPFILVTEALGEEIAIETLKKGATDYVLKDNLKRLVSSVKRALKEAEEITERKRLQKILQVNEKLYRLLAENTNDMITRHSPDGTYLYVSPACRTLFGYEPEDLIGTNSFEQMHPEDVKKIISITQEALRDARPHVARYRHFTKAGQYIWVETTGKVIKNEEGEIEDIVCVVRDITKQKRSEEELQKSEERFRVIFDNANDGILLADTESKHFHFANVAICRMLGYSQEEIKNMGVMDIHPEKDIPYVIEQFGKQSRKEIEVAQDLPMKRKDGSVFYADVNSVGVEISGKHYLLGVFRDITERKRTEEEIKKRVKELENFYDMGIGRELKMIELKNQIKKLEEELAKYKKQ